MAFKLKGYLMVCLPLALAAGTETIVDLGYAKYRGSVDPGSQNTHFLGIRYAAPPVGQLRFAPPQKPAKVTDLQLADTLPVACPQAGTGTAPETPFRSNSSMPRKRQTIPTDEDCLFLNVYVPGTPQKSQNLPVIVWIHGGGYNFGGSRGFTGVDIQHGDDLVQATNGGVVVVVIQYRLGLFGFLAGKKVKEQGSLNAGLLDQEFALKWVHKHIGKFGGDPGQVTIWGQSAGAGSVLEHVIANGGKTTPALFRGAITSSLFVPPHYHYDHEIHETVYNQVVSQANCTSANDSLTCLRTTGVATLSRINNAIESTGFFGTVVFSPVIDGTFIRQRPTEALRQGKVNGQAIYAVTTTNEGGVFVDPSTAGTVQVPTYVANLFPRLSSVDARRAANAYQGLGAPIEQVTRIMSEALFLCPSIFLLRDFKQGPAYKALFAIPPGLHGNDLVYYFPSFPLPGSPAAFNNSDFKTAFTGSFLAFIKSLNPNKHLDASNITPPWPKWSLADRTEMLFNRTEDSQPWIETFKTSPGLLDRCRFWESVASQTAQ